MRLIATSDGGQTLPSELTLEQVRDWKTKKQQRIIDALLDVDSIGTDAVFDAELVDAKLEEEMGDDRPTMPYIYQVKGQYTKVVPKNFEGSWESPFTLVQVKPSRGYGSQRRHILDLLEHAHVNDDGAIDIERLGEEVMERSGRDRRPTSYIWQTIGEFAAVVPVDYAGTYQVESEMKIDEIDSDVSEQNELYQDEETELDGVLTPEDDSVDSPSYHMGYADGYRAALRERQD